MKKLLILTILFALFAPIAGAKEIDRSELVEIRNVLIKHNNAII